MTWVAPEVTLVDEPFVADEPTMVDGWLERQRSKPRWICAGLTAAQSVTGRLASFAELLATPSNRRRNNHPGSFLKGRRAAREPAATAT
jgi:hypothetical protein